MPQLTVYVVALPGALQEVVRQAVETFAPAAKVRAARTVAEAAQSGSGRGRQLLLLHNPTGAEVMHATQATGVAEQPRWAVVVLGRGPADLVEVVPEAECQAPALARVFRAALLQHELACENLRLRGDLKTMAHRFSHDLRSPLNCIHITCELTRELLSHRMPVDAQVGVMASAVAEASALVDRVSYMLSATTEPKPRTVMAMDPVVAAALRRLDPEIRQKGARVRQPARWPAVPGVAPWLETIWWNLISNALRHGAAASEIELGWHDADGAVRFWVANPGPAPSAELQARLFRPFDQLHQGPGTGLGLSLVERLVSLQQGACGYERTAAGLSVFHFTLPLPPAD